MDWKNILIRVAILIPVAFLGWTVFALTVNAFVFFDAIPAADVRAEGYGPLLMTRAAYVSMCAILAALATISVKDSWRYVFYLAPLYAPALYAVFYVLFLAKQV